jgi:hypothetical protein
MSVANYSYPASVFDHLASTYPVTAKPLQEKIAGIAVNEKTEKAAIDDLADAALQNIIFTGKKVDKRIKVTTLLMKAYDLESKSFQMMDLNKVISQLEEGMKRELALNEIAAEKKAVTKEDESRIKKTDIAIKVMNAIVDKLNAQHRLKLQKLKPSRNPASIILGDVAEGLKDLSESIKRMPDEKKNSQYVQRKLDQIQKAYKDAKLYGSEDKKLKKALDLSEKIEDMISNFKESISKHFKKIPHQN